MVVEAFTLAQYVVHGWAPFKPGITAVLGLTPARRTAYVTSGVCVGALASCAARGLGPTDRTGRGMRGRSDNEILDWIKRVGGTEAFLEQTFSGMCDAFRADRAAGQHAVIEWDIATPDRGVVQYQVLVDQGSCHAQRGGVATPSVVLAIDMANFLRLVTGALDGFEAVESGKLGVTGDRMLARAIGGWFQGSN